MPKPMPSGKFNQQFIGLDTHYSTADGSRKRRVHMDGAASPLAAQIALDTIQEVLPHYSNTHSYVHTSAQISTKALSWAYAQILDCLGADPSQYTAIFTGSGSTSGINRVARGLADARPDRKVVLVSALEHHANDLPHRQFNNKVIHIPLQGEGADQGPIDLVELEKLLKQHKGKVNYVAFSSVSNVTGIINPVREITRLAHEHDALVLVDAAQSIAHQQTRLSDDDELSEVDFLVFSGHKLYTPMAPGVLVAKRTLLEQLSGQDLGGGSVDDVSYYDYSLSTVYPNKEQSGTPNIVGAIALARVMQALKEFGFEKIEAQEQDLYAELNDALLSIPHIRVYGDSKSLRISAIAFNHELIDHGLLAAILNDYYAIAVRNECFCAHPYVSSMLKQELWELDLSTIPESKQTGYINRKRGMVRVSTSLYNTSSDVDELIKALHEINCNYETLSEQYTPCDDGSYRHNSFTVDWRQQLNW